jgi:hypothetical protein
VFVLLGCGFTLKDCHLHSPQIASATKTRAWTRSSTQRPAFVGARAGMLRRLRAAQVGVAVSAKQDREFASSPCLSLSLSLSPSLWRDVFGPQFTWGKGLALYLSRMRCSQASKT